MCVYTYVSTWNCTQERWGVGQFLSADCRAECPSGTGSWSQSRPSWVEARDRDECRAWYYVCEGGCDLSNPNPDLGCVNAPSPPGRPELDEPSDCCPEVCRYTWVSAAECDSEGNATWGDPVLIDTTCVKEDDCPSSPSWTSTRPSWVNSTADDTCRRWYVACDEDSECDQNSDCSGPPSGLTPSPPGGTPPVPPCCTKFCKYTWESTFSCSSSGGEWSDPVLASKECVDGPCDEKDWAVGSEDSASGDITPDCSEPCKATKIVCVEFECDPEGSSDQCPDPDSEDTPDKPDIDPPSFDIFTNGRINGCNPPLSAGLFNGQVAMNAVGGRNNPECCIDSHFVAAIFNKVASNVSICDLSSQCGSSISCESGPDCCPSECPSNCGGPCSWPCDPDSFGDRLSFYFVPAGLVQSGQSPAGQACGGFTLAGGGSGCLSAPSGGC